MRGSWIWKCGWDGLDDFWAVSYVAAGGDLNVGLLHRNNFGQQAPSITLLSTRDIRSWRRWRSSRKLTYSHKHTEDASTCAMIHRKPAEFWQIFQDSERARKSSWRKKVWEKKEDEKGSRMGPAPQGGSWKERSRTLRSCPTGEEISQVRGETL